MNVDYIKERDRFEHYVENFTGNYKDGTERLYIIRKDKLYIQDL